MQVNNTGQSVQYQGSNLGRDLGTGSKLHDEFMTLMVAQIQNQDPMEPTDSSEYMNQMSQLAMLESNENLVQLTQTNQILMDNLQVLSTTNLVGDQVEVRTGNVQFDGETPVSGRIELTSNSENLVMELKDSTGKIVEVELGPQASGTVDFEINPEELGLDGEYEISISHGDEQAYQPHVFVRGVVESVDIDTFTGEMTVSVGGVGNTPIYEIGRFG